MTGRDGVINHKEKINTKYELMIIEIIPHVGGSGRQGEIIRSQHREADRRGPILTQLRPGEPRVSQSSVGDGGVQSCDGSGQSVRCERLYEIGRS